MLVARSCITIKASQAFGKLTICCGRLEKLRLKLAQSLPSNCHQTPLSTLARNNVGPVQIVIGSVTGKFPALIPVGKKSFQFDTASHSSSASWGPESMPAYWLLKSEPEQWSWQDQVKKGVESWDGVRNAQAQKNLRTMKCGDLCFFYHSVKEKAVVGVVSVCKEIYPDPSDESGKWGMVDVEAVEPLVQPVTLADMKADPVFEDLILLRQSRLSVVPLQKKHWDRIHELGSVKREEEPKKPRKRAKKEADAAEKVGQDGDREDVADLGESVVAEVPKVSDKQGQPGKRKSVKKQISKGSEGTLKEPPSETGKGRKRKKGPLQAATGGAGEGKEQPLTKANVRRSGRSKATSS